MSDKSWVDNNHYRETSSDGRTSWLYEVSGVIPSSTCVEVTDHHSDGTSTAHEYDGSLLSSFTSGGRGDKK